MPAIRTATIVVEAKSYELTSRAVIPARVDNAMLVVDVDRGTLVSHLFGTTNIGRLADLTQLPYRVPLPPLEPGDYKLVLEHAYAGVKERIELRFPVAIAPPAEITPRRMKLGLVDGTNVDLAIARDVIAPLKLHSIRPWIDTHDFCAYTTSDEVRRAIQYQAAGLTKSILFCCAQSRLRACACTGAVAWYGAFADDIIGRLDENPATRGAMLRVEVHNEPDLDDQYWDRSVADYVSRLLKPVYGALKQRHGDRVEVVSAGISWDVAELQKNARAIAESCDAVGFHGYPKSRAQFSRLTEARQIAGSVNRRLIVTEGQCNFSQSTLTVAQRQKEVAAYLQHCEQVEVDELLYFVAYSAGTPNSWGALLDRVKSPQGKTTGVATRPYYDTFAAFARRP